MPVYSRPGVFVNESPLKAVVTNRTGRTTATFVGKSSRGPTGKPVLVTSWNSFVSIFGDINASYELGYSVYQYFSNGGVECYIVRTLTASTTANTAASLALTHGSSQSLFTATSKLEGTDGNNVTLEVIKNSNNPDTGSGSTVGGSGLLDVVVKYKGVTKETFNRGGEGLTFSNNTGDTSATMVINDAVTGSKYITVSAQSTDSNVTGAKFNTAFTTAVTYTLAGGATGGTAAKATAYVQGQEEGTTANMFLLTADNSGAWANDLTVEVSAGVEVASTTTYGTFNLVVKLSGAEKERWSEVSLDPTNSRYVLTLLNNYSDYVRVSAVSTATKATDTRVTAGTTYLVGGSDGTAVLAGDYSTALNYLDQVTGDLVINLPGVSSAAEVNYALAYASNRGTGFVIIDPDTSVTSAAVAVTTVAAYTNSGYGAAYYPAAIVSDPTKTGPAALRTAPLGGAIMAIYGKAERMHSVAKAPAGLSLDLANVFGLVATFTESEEGTLYDSHINPIRLVPGTGAIINGTRTLAMTSPDKYIPIRRTLNFVKSRMKTVTAFAVFEPNDVNLRTRVISVIEQELRGLWGRKGLKGTTSAQAFYVTCNASNNTASTIANGELHVEVGLALQYPAEYVVINVSQWTGGSNATDTL
jgi:phage tail sheath protein FI